MVNLSVFYNLSIYNTEGKYVGKVSEVVLNIKKGRISYLKTKAIQEDNRNVGLRDVLRNSMRMVPEEEDRSPVTTEGIIDIPYDIVLAVGDIIIIDQHKLLKYQSDQQKQESNKVTHQKPEAKATPQKAN